MVRRSVIIIIRYLNHQREELQFPPARPNLHLKTKIALETTINSWPIRRLGETKVRWIVWKLQRHRFVNYINTNVSLVYTWPVEQSHQNKTCRGEITASLGFRQDLTRHSFTARTCINIDSAAWGLSTKMMKDLNTLHTILSLFSAMILIDWFIFYSVIPYTPTNIPWWRGSPIDTASLGRWCPASAGWSPERTPTCADRVRSHRRRTPVPPRGTATRRCNRSRRRRRRHPRRRNRPRIHSTADSVSRRTSARIWTRPLASTIGSSSLMSGTRSDGGRAGRMA